MLLRHESTRFIEFLLEALLEWTRVELFFMYAFSSLLGAIWENNGKGRLIVACLARIQCHLCSKRHRLII